jgi:hypothetical protein
MHKKHAFDRLHTLSFYVDPQGGIFFPSAPGSVNRRRYSLSSEQNNNSFIQADDEGEVMFSPTYRNTMHFQTPIESKRARKLLISNSPDHDEQEEEEEVNRTMEMDLELIDELISSEKVIPVSDFEAERLRNIARNQEKFLSLGLINAKKPINQNKKVEKPTLRGKSADFERYLK